ncbi:MAG: hypothetical protein WD226_01310 [Planctomycetota bacterium]
MTTTAKRRWSSDFQGEIDGISFTREGPVFVHGYDPPAGGKWMDDVIPGKLGAFDRGTGQKLWLSPCEVGYGRGYGAGLGEENDIVILGPSSQGHRIARMKVETGELIGLSEIESFDQAVVRGDMCLTVTPGRVAGILTTPMFEAWSFSRDGERYHLVGRDDDVALVAATNTALDKQGVLMLEVESGDFAGVFLEADYTVIHEMCVSNGTITLLTGTGSSRNRGHAEVLTLSVFARRGREAAPLWSERVPNDSSDGLPDVSILVDSGKLYVADGAALTVRDVLSGRELGELTVPGLDERIAWQVSDGAGFLAEEDRMAIFELPA